VAEPSKRYRSKPLRPLFLVFCSLSAHAQVSTASAFSKKHLAYNRRMKSLLIALVTAVFLLPIAAAQTNSPSLVDTFDWMTNTPKMSEANATFTHRPTPRPYVKDWVDKEIDPYHTESEKRQGGPVETDAADGNPQRTRIPTAAWKAQNAFHSSHRPDGGSSDLFHQ
jgi:hypothetical protein